MIKRKGNSFYLEVFNPQHDWKHLGKVMTIERPIIGGDARCFCTHIKMARRHYYIKGLGYPINRELLKMLKNGHVEYILIPEQGKRGFKAYIGVIEDYLNGELIHEPLTEEQMSIPLKDLDEININQERLKEYMYR